jgi:hypothetical protein
VSYSAADCNTGRIPALSRAEVECREQCTTHHMWKVENQLFTFLIHAYSAQVHDGMR